MIDPLVALYQKRLNLQNALFLRIEHEDAIVADVYKLIPPKGDPLILKICTQTHHYLREVYFLNFFAGKLPVPRIVEIVPPEEGVPSAILMECLPGELLQNADFSDSLAYEMGSLLARIHLNKMPAYGDVIEESLDLDPRPHFIFKFEEGLEECSTHLPQTLLERCRQYFDTHIDLLLSTDGPCIAHRDFRAGNIIVSNGKIQGVIDWSSGRSSFAEEDFCPMEHGECPNRPENKKSFLAGYASIRPLPDYKRVMPLLRLSKAIATIGFTVKRKTWASTNTKIYQLNRHFLDSLWN